MKRVKIAKTSAACTTMMKSLEELSYRHSVVVSAAASRVLFSNSRYYTCTYLKRDLKTSYLRARTSLRIHMYTFTYMCKKRRSRGSRPAKSPLNTPLATSDQSGVLIYLLVRSHSSPLMRIARKTRRS